MARKQREDQAERRGGAGEKIGLYDVIEAYRMPYYLGAAAEAVAFAGRWGSTVQTDCARAIAYLARLQKTRSDRMKPHRVPVRVARRLPPAETAAAITGDKWPGGWQWKAERVAALTCLLALCCPAGAVPPGVPVGAAALQQAADLLLLIVRREPMGRESGGPGMVASQ